MPQPGRNLQGALFGLLAFAIFSTHDVFVKLLGGSYSPAQILFFSGLLGFPLVVLLLMSDATEGHLRPIHPWWMAGRCIATLASALGAFYAFAHLPLAQVYSILFASPLIITILAIPILGEKVGAHRWAAVIVGLIGVIIVLRPTDTSLTTGHLAALSAALGGATNSVIVRKIGREERSVVLLIYPMMASFILLGGLLLFTYRPMPAPDFGMMTLIALLAFLAMLCVIRAYRSGEAAIVAPMQYSQILWATVFGYLFFGETVDRTTALGASIIILSGLYIIFRESRGPTSTTTPVLRTRTRGGTGTTLRAGTILRRIRNREENTGRD